MGNCSAKFARPLRGTNFNRTVLNEININNYIPFIAIMIGI